MLYISHTLGSLPVQVCLAPYEIGLVHYKKRNIINKQTLRTALKLFLCAVVAYMACNGCLFIINLPLCIPRLDSHLHVQHISVHAWINFIQFEYIHSSGTTHKIGYCVTLEKDHGSSQKQLMIVLHKLSYNSTF